MGRPRTFDERQALDRALEVFWAKGYEAASLSDLTQAMGLSKSSFYHAFGSKHDAFLAAIDRYGSTVAAKLAEDLRRDRPARAAIAAVFETAVEQAVGAGDRRGCFIGNCAAEVAASDPAAAERIVVGLRRIENAFHDAILRGQATGEISRRHDPRALARYLTSSLNGLRVVAKANPDTAALRDVVRIALTALD